MHATEFKLLIVNFSVDYIRRVFTLNSWQSNHDNLKIMIVKVLFFQRLLLTNFTCVSSKG